MGLAYGLLAITPRRPGSKNNIRAIVPGFGTPQRINIVQIAGQGELFAQLGHLPLRSGSSNLA